MANPYLPGWEYIPDGEPRVFGDRVYIYGSHDKPNSEDFCDYRLKVWSAPVDDPTNWTCHGDCFHTRADADHAADTDWTDKSLFAPDVVEKDGKYYLFAYIVGSVGAIAVSDRPEGPFKTIGKYDAEAALAELKAHPEKYVENINDTDKRLDANTGRPEENGTNLEIAIRDLEFPIMIDPGVLVDDDGRVYVYCGYLHSYMFELDPADMHTVVPGSYRKDILKKGAPHEFFEACSPRKINGTYYLIYSPRHCSRLAYATADNPYGPFEYRGYLVDSGVDYPGGNDHGSVALVTGQWYVFYHKMTNNTIMSRKGCADRLELKPDGTFTVAEMTSTGFEAALNPFRATEAERACILKGGCFITEKDIFNRPIVNICDGAVIGFKYFDFGVDHSDSTVSVCIETFGVGQTGEIHVRLDSEDGEEVGCGKILQADGVTKIKLKPITGVHAVYFVVKHGRTSWIKDSFANRNLCSINRIVFIR